MALIYNADDILIPWAAERIGIQRFRDDATAIGTETDGKIRSVCVFDNFSDADVYIHIASDGSRTWLTREFLVACFAFPFIQLGLPRVTGLVPASNDAAMRFDLKLGFQVEGRCREAVPGGDDLMVLGMLRRECRFIPEEYRHG